MALFEAAEVQAFVMGGGAGAERGAEGLLALGFRPEEEEDMANGRGGRCSHKHGHQQVYLPKAKDSLRCIFLRSVFVVQILFFRLHRFCACAIVGTSQGERANTKP